MKVAVLWPLMQGYLNACLKELAGRGVELLVVHRVPSAEAPFDTKQFDWFHQQILWRTPQDLKDLGERLRAFQPDVLVVAGWAYPEYRQAAKMLRGKCVRLMTADNPWKWELRQFAAIALGSLWLAPLADAIWVPGERQAIWARKLGFGKDRVLQGMYSCDQPALASIYRQRIADGRPLPHTFLYVGRMAPVKGLDVLVAAFAAYRKSCPDPWPLICCGTGPLAHLIEGQTGIVNEGFLQPHELMSKYASAGCLILPSNHEPWALVVHEAAAAGLLIVSSDVVGASPHLVQSHYNGFTFPSGDAESLTRAMLRVSALGNQRLEEMSAASHSLSAQFSPRRWADTLMDAAQSLQPR